MATTNKKTSTNLVQQPQMRATLFEPVAPVTYALGNDTARWSEIWVNRVEGSINYAVETILPIGSSGAGSPPATRTLNNGYVYYFQYTTAANLKVFKYVSETLAIVQSPATGALFFEARPTSGNNIYRILFLQNASTNAWLQFAVNRS